MVNLTEAMNNLELALGKELMKQYNALLKKWLLFTGSMTKVQFVCAAHKLMSNEDQIRAHNQFLFALYPWPKAKTGPSASDKVCFELADHNDLVSPLRPVGTFPSHMDNPSAVSEFMLPDSIFIKTKVSVYAWDSDLKGAESGAAEVVMRACHAFLKNIITAMVTRKGGGGYKVRDSKMQHGFGLAVPDPFMRNAVRLVDETQESKVEVAEEDDCFVPASRPSLESAEQQTAFAVSCGKPRHWNDRLTLRLLYDTLVENPQIVGCHSVHSINLAKIEMMMEDD